MTGPEDSEIQFRVTGDKDAVAQALAHLSGQLIQGTLDVAFDPTGENPDKQFFPVYNPDLVTFVFEDDPEIATPIVTGTNLKNYATIFGDRDSMASHLHNAIASKLRNPGDYDEYMLLGSHRSFLGIRALSYGAFLARLKKQTAGFPGVAKGGIEFLERLGEHLFISPFGVDEEK